MIKSWRTPNCFNSFCEEQEGFTVFNNVWRERAWREGCDAKKKKITRSEFWRPKYEENKKVWAGSTTYCAKWHGLPCLVEVGTKDFYIYRDVQYVLVSATGLRDFSVLLLARIDLNPYSSCKFDIFSHLCTKWYSVNLLALKVIHLINIHIFLHKIHRYA